MIPAKIDLDKLHFNHQYVVGGFPRQRGQGITYTYLEMMVGEAELGDDHNFYVYVAHNTRHADEVRKAFMHRLIEEKIELDKHDLEFPFHGYCKPNTVDVNKKSFLFSGVESLASNDTILRGINIDRVFLDVDANQVEADDRFRMAVYKALSNLKISLARRRGDII